MRITPNSVIKLYSTTGIDNINQLAFSTPAKRDEYFERLKIGELRGAQYVRRPGTIRLPLNLSSPEFQSLDFISFQNPDFENTVWYAQVQNWSYINNETTEVQYIINPLLTFMGRFVMRPSMIERQHLSYEEKEKADVNPYDESIYPLWTEEGLPVDKSMEKACYNISTAALNSADGTFLFPESVIPSEEFESDQGLNTLAVCFITPIDFADLDAGDTSHTNENLWNTLQTDIVNNGGYSIYDLQNGFIENSTVEKAFLSSMPRAYWIIAIKLNPTGRLQFNTMIQYLTTWNADSQIIGIYGMENWMFRCAFLTLSNTGGVLNPTVEPQDLNGLYRNVQTSYERANSGYTTHVDSHKLYKAPFSYMRVTTPDGQIKEYNYENFNNVNGSYLSDDMPSGPSFRLVCDLNSAPSFFAAPIGYKKYVDGYSIDGTNVVMPRNANVEERIEYDRFAQIPYTTDGYLTYQAALNAQIVGSNTEHAQQERQWNWVEMNKTGRNATILADTKVATNIVGGVVTAAGQLASENPVGAASTLYNTAINHQANAMASDMAKFNYEKNQAAASREFEEIGDANDWYRMAASQDNPSMSWLGAVRRAYANDMYHPGTNTTPYNYLKGFTAPNLTLIHVQLKDAVLKIYDEYFKKFGYNNGNVVDLPHVYHFMNNAPQDASFAPTWVNITGYPTSTEVSYIKTVNSIIQGIPRVYADVIQNMFNSGIRFINGDKLLESIQEQEENNG